MVDLPVQTLLGVRLGTIRDAWLEPGEHRLLAFDVAWDDEQVLDRDQPLPVQDLLELTAEGATVEDELGTCRGLDRDAPDAEGGLLPVLAEVVGRWIEDDAGHVIGRISDVLFDPQDGSVRAYEYVPGDDPEALCDPALLAPARGMRFDATGSLVVPVGTRPLRPSRLEIVMLDTMGLDLPLGDEDVEVVRNQPLAEP